MQPKVPWPSPWHAQLLSQELSFWSQELCSVPSRTLPVGAGFRFVVHPRLARRHVTHLPGTGHGAAEGTRAQAELMLQVCGSAFCAGAPTTDQPPRHIPALLKAVSWLADVFWPVLLGNLRGFVVRWNRSGVHKSTGEGISGMIMAIAQRARICSKPSLKIYKPVVQENARFHVVRLVLVRVLGIRIRALLCVSKPEVHVVHNCTPS